MRQTFVRHLLVYGRALRQIEVRDTNRHGRLHPNVERDRRGPPRVVLLLHVDVRLLEKSRRCRAAASADFRQHKGCTAEENDHGRLRENVVRGVQEPADVRDIPDKLAHACSL